MNYVIVCMFLMFLTTYLIRVIPIGFVRRKMENEWVKDFLYYIPFCVLSAMTFPDVLYSTSAAGTEPTSRSPPPSPPPWPSSCRGATAD